MMQNEQNLETSITRALEKKPEVVVPANFAARVIGSLPPRKQRRKLPVGQMTALAGLLALALTMFALAPQVTPVYTNFAFDLEMLLLLQMAGIGWWFFKADSRQ